MHATAKGSDTCIYTVHVFVAFGATADEVPQVCDSIQCNNVCITAVLYLCLVGGTTYEDHPSFWVIQVILKHKSHSEHYMFLARH